MEKSAMSHIWDKLTFRKDLISLFIRYCMIHEGKNLCIRFCEAEDLLSMPEAWTHESLVSSLLKVGKTLEDKIPNNFPSSSEEEMFKTISYDFCLKLNRSYNNSILLEGLK